MLENARSWFRPKTIFSTVEVDSNQNDAGITET